MSTTTDQKYAQLGETRGMENHDHDLNHDLSHRLDCMARYDHYIASSSGRDELDAFWREARTQEQADLEQLYKTARNHAPATVPSRPGRPTECETMNTNHPTMAEQLAQAASRLQEQRTGHAPKAVTVVLSEDTLVVTLHEALTPAERALAQSDEGAAQVQMFHRQLFLNSTQEMRQEIERITGRQVRETAAEIVTAAGAVVHAFTTGAMVQVYLLAPGASPEAILAEQVEKAEDDGLPPMISDEVTQ